MRTLSLSLFLAHTCVVSCLLNISKYTTFKPIARLVLSYINLATYHTLISHLKSIFDRRKILLLMFISKKKAVSFNERKTVVLYIRLALLFRASMFTCIVDPKIMLSGSKTLRIVWGSTKSEKLQQMIRIVQVNFNSMACRCWSSSHLSKNILSCLGSSSVSINNGELMLLVLCLYQTSPLNHKRTTISLAPPIFYVTKNSAIKWSVNCC